MNFVIFIFWALGYYVSFGYLINRFPDGVLKYNPLHIFGAAFWPLTIVILLFVKWTEWAWLPLGTYFKSLGKQHRAEKD